MLVHHLHLSVYKQHTKLTTKSTIGLAADQSETRELELANLPPSKGLV